MWWLYRRYITLKRRNNISVSNFEDLKAHIGHKIVCVSYGEGKNIDNVAIECEDCMEVLLDFDNYKSKEEK